jgi:hypothetical protein
VASHYLAQPLSLFGYRLVHSSLQLYLDVPQLTPHPVASGLPLKHESAAARSSTDESEAQEGERFWLSQPTSLSIGRCETAELKQARFSRVKRQRKFPKPVTHRIEETLSVVLVLEADHEIVGITYDDHVAPGFLPSPAFGPEIEAVMHVDIGEER